MKRIINHALVALTALLIGASNTKLCAATFSDDNWISMNPSIPGADGPDDAVSAMVVDGSGNLYIGGGSTAAGGVIANGVAKWNGSSWSALGSGMNWHGVVRALALSGSNLYAGGYFTNAGGIVGDNIAKWNGTNWSALGSGLQGGDYGWSDVEALAVSGNDLYVGGNFTNAGGIAANYIAKWNGSNWSALGLGMNGIVHALAVSGGDLYVGGDFTTAGGSGAYYIAKWNGSSWSALGLGMDYAVYALAVSGSNLYAGGDFITAGGIAATNIAKWNGTSWNALGLGMDTRVYALAVSDSDLYAGGEFQLAGGRNANFIAKWNGSRWRPLGSGMSSDLVSALAISGSDLYVGGGFAKAGGKDSASLARARIGSTVKSVAAANSTASIQLSGVTGYPYDVQRATNLTPPVVWTTLNSASLYPAADGSFTFTDTNAAQGHAFYRAAAISLAPTACPRLGVQQPAGTNVSSGDSIFFGAVAVGSSVTKTFTITNSGTGPLIISDVSTFWISEFVVNTTGMVTNVPAGGSTTFTVKFSPTAAGTGRVTLYVIADTTDCSDSDEGYFNLTVSGAGL